MTATTRLQELGLTVPKLPLPTSHYIHAKQVGALLFTSGQTPTVNGELQFQGKVGAELSVSQGADAARLAALNLLGEISAHLGSLDAVLTVVKLNGYVASAPGFTSQPAVIDGASRLFEEVFEEEGRHARAAVGVFELPGGAPVEVEVILAIQEGL